MKTLLVKQNKKHRLVNLLIFLSLGLSLIIQCSLESVRNGFESFFEPVEIRDIQKINAFFSEQMCGQNLDFPDCIESLNSYFIENGWQPILKKIDFEKQKDLYNSLESNIFMEIWSFCKSSNPKMGWERKSLCLNPNGKYIKFLKSISENNPILSSYTASLVLAGDFVSISLIEAEIHNKSEKINLKDPKIQFLISVDYLALNDQQKRIEPWKEELKN